MLSVPKHVKHVQMTLSNIHRLRERRYSKADYGASEVLLNLDEPIIDENLTLKQTEVIDLLYERDTTQGDVARLLDISQEAVTKHNKYGINKIARKYHKK